VNPITLRKENLNGSRWQERIQPQQRRSTSAEYSFARGIFAMDSERVLGLKHRNQNERILLRKSLTALLTLFLSAPPVSGFKGLGLQTVR
jgi:hypothetical protein